MAFCRSLPQHSPLGRVFFWQQTAPRCCKPRLLAPHLLQLAEIVKEQFNQTDGQSKQNDGFAMCLLTQLLAEWACDRTKNRSWNVQMKFLENEKTEGRQKEKREKKGHDFFLPSFVECDGVEVILKLGDEVFQKLPAYTSHTFAQGDFFTLEAILLGGAVFNTKSAQALYEDVLKKQCYGLPEPVAVGVWTQRTPEDQALVVPSPMRREILKMLSGLDSGEVRWLLRPVPSLATVELCWKALSKGDTEGNDILEALRTSFSSKRLHALLKDDKPGSTRVLPSAPRFGTLNCQQQQAYLAAFSKQISLVQGPPGTGKTHFIATLTQGILSLEDQGTVLLLAETNFAADNLLLAVKRIKELGRITSTVRVV